MPGRDRILAPNGPALLAVAEGVCEDAVAAARLLDGLPGVGFEWAPVRGISDRGSIVVPIVLAGATYRYQLDTGSDVTVIHGSEPAAHLGWKNGRKSVRVPGFSLVV